LEETHPNNLLSVLVALVRKPSYARPPTAFLLSGEEADRLEQFRIGQSAAKHITGYKTIWLFTGLPTGQDNRSDQRPHNQTAHHA
jgi:hypothetical protein